MDKGCGDKMRRWFKPDPQEEAARRLYRCIVAQARQPAFYSDWGLPDSVDGRFDLLVLHVFLAMHRLKAERSRHEALSQALFKVLFQDLDQSLREMGAGDMGVGRRIRNMAEGFYGRVMAYEQALAADDAALGAALQRNLYGKVTAEPAALAVLSTYVRRQNEALAAQEATALARGEIVFGPVPEKPRSREGADRDG